MPLPETYKTFRSTLVAGEPKLVELPLPKPGINEVLVKMAYVPVNPSDLMAMEGYARALPENMPIGFEGSGTIVALGEDLKVPHSIGDNVHVLAMLPDGTPQWGTYGEYLIVSSETCPKIKEGLSLEEAASHYVNPATVYYMAVLAEREGHKAVIHSAGSSALGRMLIRYLKYKGIKSINIVRRDDFTEELKKDGADYVLNLQTPDFEAQLKEIAEKEQATIAFDALGGSFTGTLVNILPRRSICYVYGMMSSPIIEGISIPVMSLGRKTLKTLDMGQLLEESYQKGELQKTLDEVHSLLPTLFKTNVLKVFKVDELKEAIAYSTANTSKGKVLLKWN